MTNLCPKHNRPFVRGICGPCRKESTVKPAQAPPVGAPSYNPKVCDTEVQKALHRSSVSRLPEKDYQDLEQSIHIELWEAVKRYGDCMTPALAYTISRNHIAKFIDKRVKQPAELSIDDKPEDQDEKVLEMSYAEVLLTQRDSEGVKTWEFSDTSLSKMGNPSSWMQALQERGGMATLEKFVNMYYYGTKRLVAEAMLRDPDMTVRDLPGIAKSTVARLRQIVWNDFRKLILAPLPSTNRVLARKFLDFIDARGLTVWDLEALPAEEQRNIRDSFLSENKPVIN